MRGDGRLAIVICSAAGIKTIDVDIPAHQNQKHKQQKAEHCAFSGISHSYVAVAPFEYIGFNEISASSTTTLTAFLLPPPRAGPVLGSRAPPTILT
ncbi:DUF2946 family protein [Hyphomicrobium sp.]|uniref:DUF2946 family protein n=1 Tax=Hyphomicrobium sp. TaxID=82 RepID=UPI00345A395F